MTPDAWRAEINANPSDSTVRLLYADWLEENGLPMRAEFYRWTAREDKWPTHTTTPKEYLWHDSRDHSGHAGLPFRPFDPPFEQRPWYDIDCKTAYDAFERACDEWLKPEYSHLHHQTV